MLLRQLVLIAAPALAAASGQSEEKLVRLTCPDKYELLGTSCYLVSSDTHGGADASHFCHSHNGTVAVIETHEEMNLLRDSLLKSTVYLGVNLQDIREKIFEYALKLSGHSGYLHLKSGEPDNFGGEDCLVADFAANFRMADVRCSESHAVLCKAPAVVLPATKRCQPDAVRYDTSTCFWADDNGGDLYTPSEAAEACHARGMKMTSIHSEAENDFIKGIPTFTDSVWIGLSDEDRNDTYKWSDATPLDYVNWYNGNPQGGDRDCVDFFPSNGFWYDKECTIKRGVVCRGPPDYESLG